MNKRYQTGYIKQKPYSLNTPSFNLADLRLEDIPETPSILNSNDWLNNIGSIAGGISGVIGTFLQNSRIGDTSDVEDQINSAANYKVGAYSNESLLDEWGNYNPLDYVTYSDIRGGNVAQRGLNTLSSIGSGAMGGASIGGPIGAIVGGVAGLGSSIAGWLTGNAKARRKVKELNNKIDAANRHVQSSFVNSARSIDEINDMSILSNYSAYGGPINIFGSGAIDYELAKEDLYNKQLSAMSKYKMSSMPNSFETPELAVFARGDTLRMTPSQAKEFTETYKKYYPKGKTFRAEGGPLFTHGGIWDNGLTYINEGGSHEENPFEGVQMGVDPQGIPNLVEEGEVVYNDYVFSNRMKVPKDVKKRLKIRGDTFAEAAKELSKESEERPNDPISKRGLISAMTRLQQAQEQVRMEENRGGNKYAHGGKIGRKYDGEGDEPNLLQFYTPQERWLRTLQRQGVVPTYELPAFQKPYSMMTPEERTASFNLEVPSLVDTRTPAERWMDENIKPIQFNPPAITGDAGSDTDIEDPNTNSSRQGRGLTWLRYAPAVGAGLGVLTDALGWTNSPDYGNADLVGSAVDNLTNVEFTPIGNYLTYRPLDRNYYINKLNAQAGATRRAIVNQSGGNRATALAGLLAADYNAQSALGDLARQAEEYNFNQRKDVETFNRGTNQFNSEMGLKASIANQANDKLRLQARTTQAQLRDQADARASAGRAANLTNLFDSLGEIGREEFSRNMIQTNPALYYSIDSSGRITYKNGYEDLSEAEKKVVRDAANKAKGKKKAKGGYLTIRKGK